MTEHDIPEQDRAAGFPLKNARGEMAWEWARHWQESLSALLQEHPAAFQSLRALVEGRLRDADPQHRTLLKRLAYLANDGSPLPDIHTILPAIYRETADGPCIVDPFELKTPEDRMVAQQLEDRWAARRKTGADRLGRKLFGEQERGTERER